ASSSSSASLPATRTMQSSSSNRRFHLVLAVASHFSALCLLLCFAFLRSDALFYYRGGSLLVGLLTLLVIVGLSIPSARTFSSPLNSFLASHPLRRLGQLALPAYLWHCAAAILLPLPPAVVPAAALAAAAAQSHIVALVRRRLHPRTVKQHRLRFAAALVT